MSSDYDNHALKEIGKVAIAIVTAIAFAMVAAWMMRDV